MIENSLLEKIKQCAKLTDELDDLWREISPGARNVLDDAADTVTPPTEAIRDLMNAFGELSKSNDIDIALKLAEAEEIQGNEYENSEVIAACRERLQSLRELLDPDAPVSRDDFLVEIEKYLVSGYHIDEIEAYALEQSDDGVLRLLEEIVSTSDFVLSDAFHDRIEELDEQRPLPSIKGLA